MTVRRRKTGALLPEGEAGRPTGPAGVRPVAASRSAVIIVPTTGLIVLPYDVVPVHADLEYQFHDCLAVTMVLRGPGEDVRWKFAWDLLARGLTAPAGSGDIAVRPVPGGRDAAVEVSFQPSGRATIRFPASDIGHFVNQVKNRAGLDAQHIRPSLDTELIIILEDT